MAESHPVNIFEYIDYRKFLLDKFQEKKRTERNFSHRKFALYAGLSSSNFLNLVTKNKRNLSIDGIQKFAKGFRLSEDETEYFRHMVLMNQSKTHEEKDCHYKSMLKCKGFAKTHIISNKEYEYYSEWYHPVIRELITFHNGKVDAPWIAKKIEPKITLTQAKQSLNLLQELGMIKKEKERWIQTDPIVDTGPEAFSVLVCNYHKNMISMGKESIDRFSHHHRNVGSVTIKMSQDNFAKINKAVIDFRKQLLGLECAEGEEEYVMQINIQAFPLSEVK